MMMRRQILATLSVVGLMMVSGAASVSAADPVVPLKVVGAEFQDAQGRAVRFWGVNLVALFPTHEEAERIAANLASGQVNLVRPHHLLRPSRDWIHHSDISGLNLMKDNTRDPDPEAWDRFDYLNAQLRKQGIYLSLSLHFSRGFKPGDVDVQTTTPEDREGWVAGMKELNAWSWQKGIDPMKMLPTIDARCQALQEEFARQLLNHVNPYTGLSYGHDPQVLTIEVVNESSAEYCLTCGNTFPPYFAAKLEARWAAFLEQRGSAPFDRNKARNEAQKGLRAEFFRSLDETLMVTMSRVVRATGSQAALTFSNLWRGENALEMQSRHAGFIETHMYADPLVVRDRADAFMDISRTQLRDKPFIIGEVNQAEGEANRKAQSHMRTMLPLAMSSYGAFLGYDGLVWFSWLHGDRTLGPDGWALNEDRESHLGDMISDGMMQDHLRTCGLIFRKGLVAPSVSPKTLYVDAPFYGTDYNSIMKGKTRFAAGWQNIHAIGKAFGPVPDAQTNEAWMTTEPPNPLVSDTGELVKDMARQQLTVSAPQVEAFSGFLDGVPPKGLKVLGLGGDKPFATVIAVCADDRPFSATESLVISRTCVGPDRREIAGPAITLRGLRGAADGKSWRIRLTRPRQAGALFPAFTGEDSWSLHVNTDGALVLPVAEWHECELVFK